MLVGRQGWSVTRYRAWLERCLRLALLALDDADRRPTDGGVARA
jgi:hypothetical protein